MSGISRVHNVSCEIENKKAEATNHNSEIRFYHIPKENVNHLLVGTIFLISAVALAVLAIHIPWLLPSLPAHCPGDLAAAKFLTLLVAEVITIAGSGYCFQLSAKHIYKTLKVEKISNFFTFIFKI